MSKLSERIRTRRKALGLSVDEISSLIGKNRSTIYRYESEDIENLPVPILIPLAEALHTTPEYLLGWIDDPSPGREVSDDETIIVPSFSDIRLKNEDEMFLINSYRELSEERKDKVRTFVDDQYKLEVFGKDE